MSEGKFKLKKYLICWSIQLLYRAQTVVAIYFLRHSYGSE